VRDGVCLRLYEEDELEERPEFTDPEIRRSSLAGVILRMKSLGLPEIRFPISRSAGAEGGGGGLPDAARGRRAGPRQESDGLWADDGAAAGGPAARADADRGAQEDCLAEMLPIVAALESNDRASGRRRRRGRRMRRTPQWKDAESDFIGILRLWRDLAKFRDERGRWKRNALRKYCGIGFSMRGG
jgi:ATP-dependent helicase HrpA